MSQISPEGFEYYYTPFDEYRLPKEKVERLALAEQTCKDGRHLSVCARQSAEYGVEVVCPVHPHMNWRFQEKATFQLSDFQIDLDAQMVTCPQVKINRHWKLEHGPREKSTIQAQFHKADYLACPVRVQWTSNTRGLRELTLHPREAHLALQAVWAWQAAPNFKVCYDNHTGVEPIISQIVCALDTCRSDYTGLAKTHLHRLILTAAAINLLRIGIWFEELPLTRMSRSPFAALRSARKN